MSDKPTEWQERIARIVAQAGPDKVSVDVPIRNGRSAGRSWPVEEHTMAGCRRRHILGKECLLGCSCACHANWVDMGPPVKTAAQLIEAKRRGREHAAAELASMPPGDGTITVSVPDRSKIEREHFKLCLTCGWRRGPGGRCQCFA